MVESVRRVNAYLAAASSLIGQATKHVSEHFDSDFVVAWNTLRQDLHSSSLGYRILYELRNYAQHFALPLSGVRVTGQTGAGGEMLFECGARMNRDALLTSGYEWRKRVQDLQVQEAEFDLLPLAEDYQRCLRTLILEIARSGAADLQVCAEYFTTVRRVLQAPQGARLWLFNDRGKDGAPPTAGVVVPEEQLRWLMGHLAALKSAVSS